MVIVVGHSIGIGEAICRKFAGEGAKVVVNGLPDDPIDDVVADIIREGGDAIAFAADVSVEDNALDCVDSAIDKYGKLAGLKYSVIEGT